MSKLTFYTNNTYYYISNGDTLFEPQNLSKRVPELNSIVPKHISYYDSDIHFILDVNNNLHMMDYTRDRKFPLGRLHKDLHTASSIDTVMMKVQSDQYDSSVLLFTFDEQTNVFTVESIHIHKPRNIALRKIRTSSQVISGIKNYEILNHDSVNDYDIILNGLNGDIHVFTRFNGEHFKIITEEKYKDIVLSIKEKYDNALIKEIVKNATSACIAMTGRYKITMVYHNELFFVDTLNNIMEKLQLDNDAIGEDVITNGITKQFQWSPFTHHCLPQPQKNIVTFVVMCNRYGIFQRVPRFVMFDIISLFINK